MNRIICRALSYSSSKSLNNIYTFHNHSSCISRLRWGLYNNNDHHSTSTTRFINKSFLNSNNNSNFNNLNKSFSNSNHNNNNNNNNSKRAPSIFDEDGIVDDEDDDSRQNLYQYNKRTLSVYHREGHDWENETDRDLLIDIRDEMLDELYEPLRKPTRDESLLKGLKYDQLLYYLNAKYIKNNILDCKLFCEDINLNKVYLKYRGRRQVKDIFRWLREDKDYQESIEPYNALLGVIEGLNESIIFTPIFSELVGNLSHLPNIETLNMALNHYRATNEHEHLRASYHMVINSRDAKCQPNATTFALMIKYYALNPQAVQDLLFEIKHHNIQVTDRINVELTNHYFSTYRHIDVDEYYRKKLIGCSPEEPIHELATLPLYATLARGFITAGRLDLFEDYWNECRLTIAKDDVEGLAVITEALKALPLKYDLATTISFYDANLERFPEALGSHMHLINAAHHLLKYGDSGVLAFLEMLKNRSLITYSLVDSIFVNLVIRRHREFYQSSTVKAIFDLLLPTLPSTRTLTIVTRAYASRNSLVETPIWLDKLKQSIDDDPTTNKISPATLHYLLRFFYTHHEYNSFEQLLKVFEKMMATCSPSEMMDNECIVDALATVLAYYETTNSNPNKHQMLIHLVFDQASTTLAQTLPRYCSLIKTFLLAGQYTSAVEWTGRMSIIHDMPVCIYHYFAAYHHVRAEFDKVKEWEDQMILANHQIDSYLRNDTTQYFKLHNRAPSKKRKDIHQQNLQLLNSNNNLFKI